MAAERLPSPDKVLKLSEVRHQRKNFAGARLKVKGAGYVGEMLRVGMDLLAEIAVHHTGNSKPAYLALVESLTNPGDLNGIPTMKESPDYLKLAWSPNGMSVKTDVAKLLAFKEILIPPATNLFIDLYDDIHPEYGPVLGLKMVNPEFRPVKTKKKEQPPETTGKDGTSGKDGTTDTPTES